MERPNVYDTLSREDLLVYITKLNWYIDALEKQLEDLQSKVVVKEDKVKISER